MAARVTRAKKKISAARIPDRVPGPAQLPDRLDAALTVVDLLYTTGHTAPCGGPDLVRGDLVERAIGLARMLRVAYAGRAGGPWPARVAAADHARRATGAHRTAGSCCRGAGPHPVGPAGHRRGHRLVTGALRGGRPGRFTVQAAIAALHAEAPSYASTDWPQIVDLYDLLGRVWTSPVVALNRAVAVAMADGPAAGLAEIGALEQDDQLAGYRYLPAAKADLLRRLGRRPGSRRGLPGRPQPDRQRSRTPVPNRPPRRGHRIRVAGPPGSA